METKVLQDFKVSEFLCSGRDGLYSSFNKQVCRLLSSGVEILDYELSDIFDVQGDMLCYVDDEFLKVINLKKSEVLNSIKLAPRDVVTSIGLSQSGMHIILGLEDGRIKIVHSLNGEAILNLSLFAKSKALSRVSFVSDSIILCVSQNDVIIIDIVQKSKLAKLVLKEKLDTILCSKRDVFYTNENRLFQISLNNFKKDIESKKIAVLEDDIVKIEFNYEENCLWVLTKSSLHRYNLYTKEIQNVDVAFEGAKGLAVVDNSTLVVGFTSSSLQLSNMFEKEDEVKPESNPNLIKFLTVDDSTTVRLVIKRSILNNFKDVEVAEAKDGIEALDYLKNNPDIDVMILDWNMPRMNGDEVVEIVHKTPELQHIKIVMATTEGGADRVKAMISKGVKGYLVKPLKPNSVNPLIEKMIEIVTNERAENE